MLFSHYIGRLQGVLKQFGSTYNVTESSSWLEATLRQTRIWSHYQFSFFGSGLSHFVTWFYANEGVKCEHTFSRGWSCCGLFTVDWGLPLSFDHLDNCLLIQSQLGDNRSFLGRCRCEVVLLALKKHVKSGGLALLHIWCFLLLLVFFLEHTVAFSIVDDKVLLVCLQWTEASWTAIIWDSSPLVDRILDV